MANNIKQTLAQLRNGDLKGAISLKLSEGLTEFPVGIFELADTLEVLDLSGNELTELPADFGRLKKLRILFCSNNPFTVLPEVIGDCPALDIVGFKANKIEKVPPRALNQNLRWLILTDNRIGELPREIGLCSRMQKLMLAGNRLTAIPEELSNCGNLSLLRISANRLTYLPEWLLSMPRLSWLAYSGNLFSTDTEVPAIKTIPWSALHMHGVLGEGASGVIYKGVLDSGDRGSNEVAVKLFKGAVTSDGLPEHEMNAFIAAGDHEGLPRLIGRIEGHPEGKNGLVMELISGRFRILGLPPSFESCTRDVFVEGAQLSAGVALKIAATIASVAAQLHSRGIMHGDLYAHNTLVDDEGDALLSDFGAASFYNTADAKTAYALERLEVNAFGCLLDDVLFLCREAHDHGIVKKLGQLRDASLVADVRSRPSFRELKEQLAELHTFIGK